MKNNGYTLTAKEVCVLGGQAERVYYRDDNFIVEKVEPSFSHNPAAEKRLSREVIKVIAVGGGGGNALNHIIRKGLKGIDLIAANTDLNDLDRSLAEYKIILGETLTRGLGAGAIPEVGEAAAKESLPQIRAALEGADMVYLTAGMGGGTGTGGIPVIARVAKEMNILTVAVVTKPFSFEGARRKRYAEEGIEKLRPHVDALIVVPNDRLLELAQEQTLLLESFALPDEYLCQAIQGVTDLVTHPGLVNLDFADLKTVMKEAGLAVMGVGRASGEERMLKAVRMALESPLMEFKANAARGLLMNIISADDLGLHEVQEAANYIQDILAEDVTFVWGCAVDTSLDGAVEIVLIATGFDETVQIPNKTKMQSRIHRQNIPKEKKEEAVYTAETTTLNVQEEQQEPEVVLSYSPAWLEERSSQEGIIRIKEESFDLPTFTRLGKTLHK
ncbi:MAG: cell division protein FtsZ [Synergistaceae bacterium]|nr:cell division protein FtsZ [Synergistaceae bacterium]